MTTALHNTVIQGNCIEVMQTMITGSVDFILTDPPYLAVTRAATTGRS